MRSINSLKSVITSLIANFTSIILAFFIQRFFVKILGIEYAGLNSVFSNIIAMLAVADLGIGIAITSHLYEPVKNNDTEKIKSLLKLYKKCFNIVGIIILGIGIAIIPFLRYIIEENTIKNVELYYIIYLLNTVFSYFLIYKRSILQATQKSYIVNIVHFIIIILTKLFQFISIKFFNSYLFYLIFMTFFTTFENIIIAIIANKIYPYIKEKNVKKLDSGLITDIKKKVKALILHKVGAFVVNSTDNLIITKILGLAITGLYANYNLIITSLSSLFNQVFASISGSLGDLIVEKNKEKNYDTYKKLLFFNAIIFIFFCIAYFCLIKPFIVLWIGEEYLLDSIVVVTIIINFYIQGTRNTINIFKDTAGIFYEDRFMPIIEVTTNLIISIVLAKFIGLPGVILGTIISSLIVIIYGHAKYVYTPLFGKSRFLFIKENAKYILLGTFDLLITYGITNLISINNTFLQLIINGIIVVIIPNLINYIILRKTEEFQYYKNFIINLKDKIFHRVESN